MPRGTIYLDHCCVSILTPTNEASALAHAESLLNGIQPPRSLTSSREDDKAKKYVPTHEKSPHTRTKKEATALLYNPIELRKGHFFIPVSSALFGGLGPIFYAFVYLLAQRAYALGEFASVAEANRALIAEVIRTQMEHCMMTLTDYMHPVPPPRPAQMIVDDPTE